MELDIFQGNALNAVDGKGRLSVPSFIRSVLDRRSDAKSVRIGLHERSPCLTCYGSTYADYLIAELERRRLNDEVQGRPVEDHDERVRGLFGMTEEAGYDSSGRISLPPLIREEGGIEDLALFVGAGPFVEIWNPRLAIEQGGARLKRIATFYLKQKGISP